MLYVLRKRREYLHCTVMSSLRRIVPKGAPHQDVLLIGDFLSAVSTGPCLCPTHPCVHYEGIQGRALQFLLNLEAQTPGPQSRRRKEKQVVEHS